MKLCIHVNGQWATVKTDPKFVAKLFVVPEKYDYVMLPHNTKHRVYFPDTVLTPEPGENEHHMDIFI